MIDLRLIAAVAASKTLTRGLRLTGRGGGTALPGLVAGKIDPNLLDKLAGGLTSGAVVIAGTNGKTTTARMLASMLEKSDRRVIHNRSGSNLVRGISAAFAERASLAGKPRGDIAVIETDENAFPEVVRRAKPRVVVLLNLFRDQLDRYGEMETIASLWRPALKELDRDTILIINADDPNLAALAQATKAQIVTFGLNDSGYALPELPHAADASICRRCEAPLKYHAHTLSHLGDYYCDNCGNARPELDVVGRSLQIQGIERTTMQVLDQRGHVEPLALEVDIALPGVYNAYNALAAITTARVLGVAADPILDSLRRFEAAFGRLERITYRGRNLTLALAKNPVGFNEVLRMITAGPFEGTLVIGINDLDADGRDVSWLWDVDFETLAGINAGPPLVAIGIRGDDLAVRLKYAGVPNDRIEVEAAARPLAEALDHIVAQTKQGDAVFCLLTYTALLQLRKSLADRGAVAAFWDQ